MRPDTDFSRLGDDGFVTHRAAFYAAMYPVIREAARRSGYGLALHGSLTKDLDVVAVPWTEDAVTEAELVQAIVDAAGGSVVGGRTERLHGRSAWTIHLGIGGYIDLSVMPRATVSPT